MEVLCTSSQLRPPGRGGRAGWYDAGDMPDPPQPDFAAQLAALRQQYIDDLPGRIDEIEAGWAGLAGDGYGPEACQALFRTVHSLAGSAPSFGHHALGDAARELEAVIDGLRGGDDPPGAEHDAAVAALLIRLRALAAEARA